MTIIAIDDVESCFDGSWIKEIHLNSSITSRFIEYLSTLGEMQYFPEFTRPFFKLHVEGKYLLKGIEGNSVIRMIAKPPIEKTMSQFQHMVLAFKGGEESNIT
ncbi:MAG: hypothetical protein NTV54_00500 [Ignavibacteriales bacterium]|nr:hypothetical protein [Ignavibacteriales bacterium]